jgi:hypothetical protein
MESGVTAEDGTRGLPPTVRDADRRLPSARQAPRPGVAGLEPLLALVVTDHADDVARPDPPATNAPTIPTNDEDEKR